MYTIGKWRTYHIDMGSTRSRIDVCHSNLVGGNKWTKYEPYEEVTCDCKLVEHGISNTSLIRLFKHAMWGPVADYRIFSSAVDGKLTLQITEMSNVDT